MHTFQKNFKQQQGKELFLTTQIAINMISQLAIIILLFFQIFRINKPSVNGNYNGRFGINYFDYNSRFGIILTTVVLCSILF